MRIFIFSGRGEDEVPRTLLIVLKNLRVFGHFDNKIFVDLMKDIDYLNLKAHDSLFKVKYDPYFILSCQYVQRVNFAVIITGIRFTLVFLAKCSYE